MQAERPRDMNEHDIPLTRPRSYGISSDPGASGHCGTQLPQVGRYRYNTATGQFVSAVR